MLHPDEQEEGDQRQPEAATVPSLGHVFEVDLRRLHQDVLEAKGIASALAKEVNETQKTLTTFN